MSYGRGVCVYVRSICRCFCSLGNLFVGNLYGIVFLEMKYVGSSVIEYLEGVG